VIELQFSAKTNPGKGEKTLRDEMRLSKKGGRVEAGRSNVRAPVGWLGSLLSGPRWQRVLNRLGFWGWRRGRRD